MKQLRKTVCMMMAIIMMMSIIAFPASANSALDSRLLLDFPNFPQLQMHSSGGYVRLLQRFLYVCPATHEAIYNTNSTYHGIDGGFGQVTDGAVRTFQLAEFGRDGLDGIVGHDTWRAIYRWLNPYHENHLYFYDGEAPYNRYVMWYSNNGSDYALYTYDHNANKNRNAIRQFIL